MLGYDLHMKRILTSLVLIVLLGACLPKQPLGQMCYIESIPPEADVYVMGKLYGETPIGLELPPGSKITLSKSGYQSATIDPKNLEAGYKLVRLEQLYKIKLSYMPEGSEVWEDGKLIGKTPLVIERIAGKVTFVARHEYHQDLTDSFTVTGESYRMKTLKPTVKYFPGSICTFSSQPKGVTIDNYNINEGKIADKSGTLGVTPFEITNAELFKLSSDHLFVFRKEGFAPRVLTGSGSFFAHIEMEKTQNYSKPVGKWVSTLEFKTGELSSASKSYTLWAEKRDKSLAIISKKGVDVEVDILDMKTVFSDVSGAAWLDDRFFVVRTRDATGRIFYIIYDAVARRRFRIENAGFWHEAIVAGSIDWKLQIPIKPTQVEEFSDIIIESTKNFSVATFRLYDGLKLEFTILADTLFDKSKLVGIEEK